MEPEKKDEVIRGSRGLRGSRIAQGRSLAIRGSRGDHKQSTSPRPINKEEGKENESAPRGRGSRGNLRGTVRRGRGILRKNRRLGQMQNRRNRLERAQNAFKSNNNGRGVIRNRGRGGRFWGMRRKTFGRKNIFIAGLPKTMNNNGLFNLMKNSGRILRQTVLKDRYGVSRGIAFVQFQNPRDAWAAIQKWNNKIVFGNSLHVVFKRPVPRRNNYNYNYNSYSNRNNTGYNGYGRNNNYYGNGYSGYSRGRGGYYRRGNNY